MVSTMYEREKRGGWKLNTVLMCEILKQQNISITKSKMKRTEFSNAHIHHSVSDTETNQSRGSLSASVTGRLEEHTTHQVTHFCYFYFLTDT